jgi:hypothetical protein
MGVDSAASRVCGSASPKLSLSMPFFNSAISAS